MQMRHNICIFDILYCWFLKAQLRPWCLARMLIDLAIFVMLTIHQVRFTIRLHRPFDNYFIQLKLITSIRLWAREVFSALFFIFKSFGNLFRFSCQSRSADDLVSPLNVITPANVILTINQCNKNQQQM